MNAQGALTQVKRVGGDVPICDDRGEHVGRLVAITKADERLIVLLTEWRNTFGRFFLTQFVATPERTERWLKEVLLPDRTRLMFMVEDAAGEPVGHVGVRRLDQPIVELDNMIRGRPGGGGQLMFLAERALLRWIFDGLGALEVRLYVLSNNWIPIGIHQTLGFEITEMLPLVRREVGNEIHLVVGSGDGELQKVKYARMTLPRSKFVDHSC